MVVSHSPVSQMMENDLRMAQAAGFDPENEGVDYDEFLQAIQHPDSETGKATIETSREAFEMFQMFVEDIRRLQDTFAAKLELALNPKDNYNIDIQWRPTQERAIQAFIAALRSRQHRLVFEIPTGGGKSMLFGVLARCYYDACTELGIDPGEIVTLTSRINLTKQMVGDITQEEVDEEAEESEDDPLELGDLMIWMKDVLDPETQLRVIAGKTSRDPKQLEKEAILTVATYQGNRPGTAADRFKRKVGLVLNDETHNLTEAQKNTQNGAFGGAFFVGGSATVMGPNRDPFDFYEAKLSEEPHPGWKERLTFFESIQRMVENRELKSMRYIEAETKIDMSGCRSKNRDTLIQREAEDILAHNIELAKDFLREVFLGDYPILETVGTKQIHERQWLIAVPRVRIARELAEFVNQEIAPVLGDKFEIGFVASHVDGEMEEEEFEEVITQVKNGEIRVITSCKKAGEGLDVPPFNGFLCLWPLGVNSEWMLKQLLGRCLRINPDSPEDDLLVIDGALQSERHNLASVLGIIGVYRAMSGGLIAAPKEHREVESQIFILRKNGFTWEEIWKRLTQRQREIAPYVEDHIHNEGTGTPEEIPSGAGLAIDEIKFINKTEVLFAMASKDKEQLLDYIRLAITQEYPHIQSIEDLDRYLKTLRGTILTTNRFDRIGSWMDLISMVLGERHDKLPGSVQTRFLETLKHLYVKGEIVEREMDDTALKTCENYCLREFFVIPRISVVKTLDGKGNPYFEAQATVSTHYDREISTPIIKARHRSTARALVAESLQESLEAEIQLEFHWNKRSPDMLEQVCTFYGLGDQTYKVDKAKTPSGKKIYTCEAGISKLKARSGTVYASTEEAARAIAAEMLIPSNLQTYNEDEDIMHPEDEKTSTTKLKQLETIIKQRRSGQIKILAVPGIQVDGETHWGCKARYGTVTTKMHFSRKKKVAEEQAKLELLTLVELIQEVEREEAQMNEMLSAFNGAGRKKMKKKKSAGALPFLN